jgi:amidase
VVANERRQQLAADWRRMFRDYDVLLCPVTPTTAIPHDHTADTDTRRIVVNGVPMPYWDQLRWVQAISTVNLPVAAVPVGLSAAGLPVGMQIVGPYLEDRTVIDVAARLASTIGGFRPPPGL